MRSTKIEVYDPSTDRDILSLIVPGDVAKEQIRKELKIGITLTVDLGEKKKRKTFEVKIYDDELKKAIENYVNALLVKLTILETEEQTGGEFLLGELKSE